MSDFSDIWAAAALPAIKQVHGFSVTITRASSGATQTVTGYDALGEMLGAVDVRSERNIHIVVADLSTWEPTEGDSFTPADDGDTYKVMKASYTTHGTIRLQGWKPELAAI